MVVHIGGAIALFGPTFVYPFLGAIAQKEGSDPKTVMRVGHAITKYLVVPADYVMPASGALLILQSKGLWDPFDKSNRWLLGSIILFTVMYALANLIVLPTERKAHALAEQGNIGPEFGALMQKQAKVGPILGMLMVAIIILMIVKPGSGISHF